MLPRCYEDLDQKMRKNLGQFTSNFEKILKKIIFLRFFLKFIKRKSHREIYLFKVILKMFF